MVGETEESVCLTRHAKAGKAGSCVAALVTEQPGPLPNYKYFLLGLVALQSPWDPFVLQPEVAEIQGLLVLLLQVVL